MARRKKDSPEGPRYCIRTESHMSHSGCDGIFTEFCTTRDDVHGRHTWSRIGAYGFEYIKECPGVTRNEERFCMKRAQHLSHDWSDAEGTYFCRGLKSRLPEMCHRIDYHEPHNFEHVEPGGILSFRKIEEVDRLGTVKFTLGCPGRQMPAYSQMQCHYPGVHSAHTWRDLANAPRLQCLGIRGYEEPPVTLLKAITRNCSNKEVHIPHEDRSPIFPQHIIKCPGVAEEFQDYKCGLKKTHGPHISEEKVFGKRLRCFGNFAEAFGAISPNAARLAMGLKPAPTVIPDFPPPKAWEEAYDLLISERQEELRRMMRSWDL